MKKLIAIFILILTIVLIPNVYAADVSIESITMESKSDNTTIVNEATYSNLKVNFDVKFTNKDDYIKYKIVINNPTNEDYEITDTQNTKPSEYIKYEYTYDDNNKIVEKNKKTILYVTITYDKEVPENLLLSGEPFQENNSITISLGNNELNPDTGRIIVKALILIILILGIALTIYVNKINKKTIVVLLITSLFIPISVYALKQISINVDSKITIEQPPVFYINNQMYRFDSNMTWHDWVNSNYNRLRAVEQDYYMLTIYEGNEHYRYFENNNKGIITGSDAWACNSEHFLYNYYYIQDQNQPVFIDDLIKNNYHYSINTGAGC